MFSDKNRHQWAKESTENRDNRSPWVLHFTQVSPNDWFSNQGTFAAPISFLLAIALRTFKVRLWAAIPKPVLFLLHVGTARLKHYLARHAGKKGCCEATWGQLQLQRNSFPSGVSSTRRQWFSNLAAQKIPGVQAPIHTNYSRIPGGSRQQYLLKLSTLYSAQPHLRTSAVRHSQSCY